MDRIRHGAEMSVGMGRDCLGHGEDGCHWGTRGSHLLEHPATGRPPGRRSASLHHMAGLGLPLWPPSDHFTVSLGN